MFRFKRRYPRSGWGLRRYPVDHGIRPRHGITSHQVNCVGLTRKNKGWVARWRSAKSEAANHPRPVVNMLRVPGPRYRRRRPCVQDSRKNRGLYTPAARAPRKPPLKRVTVFRVLGPSSRVRPELARTGTENVRDAGTQAPGTNRCTTRNVSQAITAAAGIVRIQAQMILAAIPQRTAFSR